VETRERERNGKILVQERVGAGHLHGAERAVHHGTDADHQVVVDAGLFVFALLTYRFVLGAVLVVPLAMIFERSVAPDVGFANL
jgi:hypothetical protein